MTTDNRTQSKLIVEEHALGNVGVRETHYENKADGAGL
jgi:hypothetical protein